MEILCKNIFVERFGCNNSVIENYDELAVNDQNQVTPQYVIDSLPSYTIRLKDPYLRPENSCAFCCRTYSVGDRVICLPCQHHFHNHCIENWLKWVKPTCPEDKKSVIRQQCEAELIKESRNRFLDEKTVGDAQCNSKHGKESFRNVEELENFSVGNPPSTVSSKKQVTQTSQTAEAPTKTMPDLSLIVSVVGYGKKKHCRTKPKEPSVPREIPLNDESSQREENKANECNNPCIINDKEQDALLIMSPNKRKRMQESIDAIRRSIKPGVLKPKKRSGNPEEFQNALKMAVAKLSKTRISSSQNKSKEIKSLCEAYLRSPAISIKESERYVPLGLMTTNTGIAFSDLLESGRKENTGWIYKRTSFDC